MVKAINREVLDRATEADRRVERLRMNFDLRNSFADNSQRILNAIEQGPELPIHRHRYTSETCIVFRGAA